MSRKKTATRVMAIVVADVSSIWWFRESLGNSHKAALITERSRIHRSAFESIHRGTERTKCISPRAFSHQAIVREQRQLSIAVA